MDRNDALTILRRLQPDDCSERFPSHLSGDWMYVFRPVHSGVRLYIKIVLRTQCIVVSFHDDQETSGEGP